MRSELIHRKLTAAVLAASVGLSLWGSRTRADDAPPAADSNAGTKSPSTRPARQGPFGGMRRDFGGGGGMGSGFGGMQGRRPEQTSQEETDSAIQFFIENSPIRMKYYKELAENSPQRRMVAQGLVRTFRPIQTFKDQSPDLYQLLVQQIKLRDEAFQLALDSDKGNKQADQKLHDKAAEIVDVTLKARAQRIELLQRQLTEQQNKLTEDQSNQGGQVDNELSEIRLDEQRLLRHMDRMKQGDRMGGPRGQAPPELPEDPLASVGPATPPN